MKSSRSIIFFGILIVLVGCCCVGTMTRVRLLELKWYILAMFNVILPCLQGIKIITHSQKMITSILFEILWLLFGNLTMIISFVSLIILL
jgi:hypothetical protein